MSPVKVVVAVADTVRFPAIETSLLKTPVPDEKVSLERAVKLPLPLRMSAVVQLPPVIEGDVMVVPESWSIFCDNCTG